VTDDDRPDVAHPPGSDGSAARPTRPPAPAERWDDDRLAAAFADRYERPAPRDLTIATLERIAATRPRPRWWPSVDRPTRDRFVAVVAVVVVVAVVGVVAQPRPSRPGTTATGPAGSGTAQASGQGSPYPSFEPSPAVAGFATDIAGLPVRSIADAAQLLDEPTLGDTELAIAGWYSASDLALPCPYQPEPASPIESRCVDVRTWLAATDRPIVSADGTYQQPADSATVLPLRFVASAEPLGGDGGPRQAMNTTPQAVVAVGHFHDERSSRCPANERPTCERTFVVDVLSSGYGTIFDRPTSVVEPPPATRLSGAAARRLAQDRVGPYAMVLQVGLELGSDAPWFTTRTTTKCRCPATWFVRGWRPVPDGTSDPRPAGTPVASWLTVDDATGAIGGPLVDDLPAPATPFTFAPAPDGFPDTTEGLPVRTVADVLDPTLDKDPTGPPIAVAGWFTRLPYDPCPNGSNLCSGDRLVLAGTDQRLVTDVPGGSPVIAQITGPYLRPTLVPGGAVPPAVPVGTPIAAVFVLRAGSLGLEQVAWLDGKGQGPTVWVAPGLVPKRTAQRALTETDVGPLARPGTWAISISAVIRRDLPAIGLEAIDAGPTTDPDAVVWAVRLVGQEPGAVSSANGYGWALVDDGTGSLLATRWTLP
jgi:hypothetical protein